MADLKPLPGSRHSLATQLLFIMHSRLLLAVALPPGLRQFGLLSLLLLLAAEVCSSVSCHQPSLRGPPRVCRSCGLLMGVWGVPQPFLGTWNLVGFLPMQPICSSRPLLRASAAPLLSAVATLAFPLLTDPASCKLPGDRSHKHELCNPGPSRRLKPSMPTLPSLPAVLNLDVALPNGHVFPCYGMPPGPAALWEHREVISVFLSQTSTFPLGCASCDAGCRRERGHLSLAPPGTCLI